MNEKNFKTMVRLQKQFKKLYGSDGAGLLGLSENYAQVRGEVFAPLCFEVRKGGSLQLDIKGGTAAESSSKCHYIHLRVMFEGVWFIALASSPEWDKVGFPMTKAIEYAQADRGLDYVPGDLDPEFWSIVLERLVFLLEDVVWEGV